MRTLIVVVLILLASLAQAQVDTLKTDILYTSTPDSVQNTELVFTKFLEIGVSSNAYKGDLHPKYHLWSSAFQLGIKWNFQRRWNSHLELSIGSIRGQNYDYVFDESTRPNRSFKTDFVSLQYDLQYNIVKKKNWLVYISQGIGFMRYTVKDDQGQDLKDMLNSRAPEETLNTFSAMLPTSIGAMYWFPNGYGAGTQISYRNTTSDYLDNISQWGKRVGADNILSWRISFVIPLSHLEHFEWSPIKDRVRGQ